MRRTFYVILGIFLLAFIAIQTEFVQNSLTQMAVKKLSAALNTEVRIDNVSFSLFNRLSLEGTLIRDRQKDTLLYAKALKVRITDWFFLHEKPDLKYIGLEDAVIKMYRKDSTWNYGFIEDYFASPNPSKQKGDGVNLDLKKLDLKNIRFLKNDEWVGERMDVAVNSFLLDADSIDLKKKVFKINAIELDQPFVRIQDFDGLRPVLKKKAPGARDTGMYFNEGDISLRVADVKIKNGSLFIDSDTDQPSSHFDGAHIHISGMNGTLSSVKFIKDTLQGNISLAAKDRCGLEIKKLKANYKLTPQIMELSRLDLQTAKSHITNYYAMQFRDFNKDFGKYNTNVVMNAFFKNAKVSSDDIAYFAPELKTWKKEVVLDGHFKGTVSDFTVTGLKAQAGATSNITGTLSMKGLPDIDKTMISFTNGTLQTNHYDLGIFIPALKEVSSPNLAALGTIYYRGNFKGTISNFVTAGSFSTQLGGLITNISLQLPRKGEPTYTGALETVRFNMGKFLGDSSTGLVNFKGNVTGTSFDIDKIKTTLEGKISSLEYNGYSYSNITTNGTLQRKYFNGELKVDDPNFDLTSTLEIDLTRELPRFNIVGDLVHSNLKALNFLQKPIEVTGLLDANFTGTNIDNFSGTLKFLNANIRDEKTNVSFDSLSLNSSKVDSIKLLHVSSNEFNATVLGKFHILDLPGSFQGFLNHYYPTYIKAPKSIPQNQQFSFIVNTYDSIEPYIQLFDASISGFNNTTIAGSVDTRTNILGLDVKIPYGKVSTVSFNEVDIFAKGNKDTLSLNGTIGSVQVSDSLHFPNTRFNIVSNNDHSVVSIKTSADYTLNDADLFADVYTLSDGVRVHFQPSSFVLNDKKWSIEKSGEIIARKNLVHAQGVKFSQGFQEISVESEEEQGANTNKLVVKLRNVILGDLTSLFFKNPRMEGVTTGSVAVSDLFGDLKAEADLKAEQFRLDDDSIGLVTIQGQYDSKTGKIPFTVKSPNQGYRFTAQGSYNVKDTSGRPLNTDIQLENSKIDILHRFLSDIFSDIKGQASGNINISGDPNAPDLLGKIKLRKAGLKVNYTQVSYTIDSADISFEEDGINFGKFNIQDKYKNTGTVSGKLKEKGFKGLDFDFDLTSSKLLLIDTKATDNQQFYGKAIGKVTTMRFAGPETACKMTIVAESNDSSHIYIPNSVNRESATADFIEFRQYGTEMTKEKKNSNFNLTVDLTVTATNKVSIDVILDELSGDVIKAVGNGTLKIRAGSSEALTMRGRYNIENGNYDFNFQSLVRKPFILLPNAGNYIEWTGDPFKADVHIDAQYTAERVSLSDLIGSVNLSSTVKGYRGDVLVIAQLREKLNKPDIKFRLDFPQGSPVKSDNDFAQFLSRLEKDQNEILKQVAFLVVLNSFAPATLTGGTANNGSVNSIVSNTISQIVTKEINKGVSNLVHKLTGNGSLRFDVGTSFYNSSSMVDPNSGLNGNTNAIIDRTRVDLKFGYAFLNDKIVVTVGSDIDINLGNSTALQNGSTQWLPNLNIEFVLSQDKKLRLIVFKKTTLDVSFGRSNRQGVSISYRKDFEKLFGNKQDDIVFKPATDSTGKKAN